MGGKPFYQDLVAEAEHDIRECLRAGAFCVQIDFTEGRLVLKLDPSGEWLDSLVDLNNRVLNRFSAADQQKIGVHTCLGGDQDSTHSADIDSTGLLPALFRMKVGRFYIQLASEPDRRRVPGKIRTLLQPDQILFIGVIDPINPSIETLEEVRARTLEAADLIPARSWNNRRLLILASCGRHFNFASAFAKIRSGIVGTALASQTLGL